MKILGHRGDRENYKDNTFESFSSAFELGADGIELDIWLNNDEVYVTHHYNHDRNGTYPLLGDVFDKFGRKGKIQIEIKDSNPKIIASLSKLVAEHDLKEFEITSSQHIQFSKLQKFFDRKNLGLIVKPYLIEKDMSAEYVDKMLINWLNFANANNLWVVDLENKFWSKERVQKFHEQGITLGHHLISNTLEAYNLMLEWDVDSIISDKLSMLKRVQ